MKKTIKNNVKAEIVEKKSKFIAEIFHVSSEEDAKNKIGEVKKKYYDAKHHCFAYSIMTNCGITDRFSDDGEPSGTAGGPMLNILNRNELINVLVVVTRYFGGILLGTGGLVKAYSEATLEAIKEAEFVIEELGYEIKIALNYNEYEKFNYYCNKNNISIDRIEYEDKVICYIEMNKNDSKNFTENIDEFNFKIENYQIIKEKNIRKNIEK